ncbi:hypothetical protein F5144DRAFT_370614 [Chaetomium tenue]|uniref:Uncharacterized protein n=1 Tax=Chaetomium tenue TaxID=1854479 RepID=A0ACB7P369_9PEZI|nr:hypothetical protein F5144DRAFT_370614 [Chaetomium globosum]
MLVPAPKLGVQMSVSCCSLVLASAAARFSGMCVLIFHFNTAPSCLVGPAIVCASESKCDRAPFGKDGHSSKLTVSCLCREILVVVGRAGTLGKIPIRDERALPEWESGTGKKTPRWGRQLPTYRAAL